MALDAFRVTEFRSIQDSGWIETGPVTLLIGRNNSGKSAILRALTLMQAGSVFEDSDQRLRAGHNSALEFRFDDDPPRRLLERTPDFSGEIPQGTIFRTEPNSGYLRARWSAQSDRQEGSAFVAGFKNQRPMHYLVPVFARRRSTVYEENVSTIYANSVEESDRQLTSRIFALSSGTHQEAKTYRQMFERVFGVSISTYLSNQGQQPGIPVSPYEGVSLRKMGDGIGAATRIITELADSSGKLFLIEEPETDLHPEAISTLLDLIVESLPNNQFIVSTHSDVVLRRLGAIEGVRVYETSLEPDVDLPTTRVTEVVTRAARLKVLSQLGYEPDLPPGWLVFEESTAERVCREVLIPRFVPRLAQLRTISALGAGAVPKFFTELHRVILFAHLSAAYSRKAWVVVDNDSAGCSAVAKLQQAFSDWPPNHFLTFDKPYFEDYYPERFSNEAAVAVSEKDWGRAEN